MSYRATNESGDQSPVERVEEARRILDMGLIHEMDRMTAKEAAFVEQMVNDQTYREVGMPNISIKQLWWLRDLKDKYLL
jgi:hypothetical protein